MGELFNAIIGKPEPTAEIDESLALSLVTSRSIQEWLKFQEKITNNHFIIQYESYSIYQG